MVLVVRWQNFACEQKLDELFQFIEVLASLLKPLHVAVKLARIARRAH
jgi:hypothetical protein